LLGWAATDSARPRGESRGHGQTSLEWAAKLRRSWRAASGAGLENKDGLKRENGEWREKEKVLNFKKNTQANEFKQRFEFKHSNQCTNMYATVNPYISLIN
jgi:hypothetical protein